MIDKTDFLANVDAGDEPRSAPRGLVVITPSWVVELTAAVDRARPALQRFMANVETTAQRASQKVNTVVDAGMEWVGSDDGQTVLTNLDLLMLSTSVSDFTGRTGIYRPIEATFMRDALEHIEYHAPFDLRRVVASVAPGSNDWSWIRDGLLLSPVLQSRRQPLTEAIDSMEDHRWFVAVSALLPILEGVTADKSGVFENMRVSKRLEQLLDSDDFDPPNGLLGGIIALPALRVIDREIFARREFAGARPGDGDLNRHLIVHGRTAGYGSEINAVRAFMIVVALAELFDGPIALRTELHHATDATLFEDFSRLQWLRDAGLRRRAARGQST